MANDVQELFRRIEQLEHASANKVRFGRVTKNEKGEVVAQIGTNPDGKPVLSPLTNKSQQNGFVSENTPWAEGQAVAIIALDADGAQTVAIPHGPNDYHPAGGDAADDKVTRRIRKPPEKKKGQDGKGSNSSAGSGGGQQQEPEKQKDDDENDWIEEQSYNSRKTRKGKMVREYGRDKNGNEFINEVIDKLGFKKTKDGLSLTIDGTTYDWKKSGFEQNVDGTIFKMTKGGFDQTGGKQTHDGKNVGAGHIHGGVMTGGAKTAAPEPDA